MKLATTTGDFVKYLDNIYDNIKEIRNAGFRCVDLGLLGTETYFADGDSWRDEIKRLREYAENLGVTFVQAHSPNATLMKAERLEQEQRWAVRSIEICELLGINNVVVHAGYGGSVSKNEWYEWNANFYRSLFPVMEKTGVNVLTENTTVNNLAHDRFYIFTGADMVEFIEYVNHPLFHAVWDTGHGISEGSQYENIMALGNHLRAIHVHDNSGRADEHALPYTGILNLDDLINGLIDVGYDGYFTFEAEQSLQPSRARNKRQRFERDTRLLEPTLEMQIAAEKLLYTIGKSALAAYGIFEE